MINPDCMTSKNGMQALTLLTTFPSELKSSLILLNHFGANLIDLSGSGKALVKLSSKLNLILGFFTEIYFLY